MTWVVCYWRHSRNSKNLKSTKWISLQYKIKYIVPTLYLNYQIIKFVPLPNMCTYSNPQSLCSKFRHRNTMHLDFSSRPLNFYNLEVNYAGKKIALLPEISSCFDLIFWRGEDSRVLITTRWRSLKTVNESHKYLRKKLKTPYGGPIL